MRAPAVSVLLFVAIAAFAVVASASTLTFQVEPKSSECFFEVLSSGSPFDMNFEVLRGGLLDIKFQLVDPNQNVVQDRMAFFNKPDDEQNEAEGKVGMVASTSGPYKFCFDNTMSRWTAKVVSFEVKSKRSGKEEVAMLEHLGPMVDSVIKISDDLDAIEKFQKHSRKREKNHFLTLKGTNSRMQWMAIFSTAVLIGLSLFSLGHIQKWFTEVEQRSGV